MPEKNEYQRVEEACARINKLYQFTGMAPQLLAKLPQIPIGAGPDFYTLEELQSATKVIEEIAADYESWWKKEQEKDPQTKEKYAQERKKLLSMCLEREVWVTAQFNPETGLPLTLVEKQESLANTLKVLDMHWMQSHIDNTQVFREIMAKVAPELIKDEKQMTKYEDLFRAITHRKFFDEVEKKIGISHHSNGKQVAKYAVLMDKFPPLLKGGSLLLLVEQAAEVFCEHEEMKKKGSGD